MLRVVDTPNKTMNENNLIQCLTKFVEIDVLDNENKRDCDSCRSELQLQSESEVECEVESELQSKVESKTEYKQKAFKRYFIHTAPPILILHLKRFQQSGLFGQTYKINDAIEFEEELDLEPFMIPDDSKKRQTKYKLTGIVVHNGSLRGGHYIAFVKRMNDWIYCSDTHTRISQWDQVKKAQAYLLFYEKVTE